MVQENMILFRKKNPERFCSDPEWFGRERKINYVTKCSVDGGKSGKVEREDEIFNASPPQKKRRGVKVKKSL